MVHAPSPQTSAHYRLRFDSLVPERRPVAVPCNAQGQVHMDDLDERTRCDYLFARAMVGHEFARPRVSAA